MKLAHILYMVVVLSLESCGQKDGSNDLVKVTPCAVLHATQVRTLETSNYIHVEDFLPVGPLVSGAVDSTKSSQERNVIFPNFLVFVNYSGLSVRSNSNMIIPRESLLKFKSSSKGIYTAKTESVKSLSLAIEKCLLNDNDSNRAVFDEELESRSIEKFINKIDRYLYET